METKKEGKNDPLFLPLFASALDLLRSFEHTNAERREREMHAFESRMIALRNEESKTPKKETNSVNGKTIASGLFLLACPPFDLDPFFPCSRSLDHKIASIE